MDYIQDTHILSMSYCSDFPGYVRDFFGITLFYAFVHLESKYFVLLLGAKIPSPDGQKGLQAGVPG